MNRERLWEAVLMTLIIFLILIYAACLLIVPVIMAIVLTNTAGPWVAGPVTLAWIFLMMVIGFYASDSLDA